MAILYTYLMGTGLGNGSKIGNVDSLFQHSLVGSVKDRAQGNVLEHLVHAKLVWIEDHGGQRMSPQSALPSTIETRGWNVVTVPVDNTMAPLARFVNDGTLRQ